MAATLAAILSTAAKQGNGRRTRCLYAFEMCSESALPCLALPQVQEAHRPFFCLDLSYAHTLLTKGFKIPESTTITLVKKVGRERRRNLVGWLADECGVMAQDS